jgi:choline dehydrogenase-like flavoprotein
MQAVHIRTLGNGQTNVAADVCILGAGAGGIYLACRLAELGVSVALLEAGDQSCMDGESIGIQANMTQDHYSGATLGRAFGLGGTTSLWGGQLVPHSAVDIPQGEGSDFEPWSHIVDITEKYSSRVRRSLDIANGATSDVQVDAALGKAKEVLECGGLKVMASEFLPFRKKNFKFLLHKLRNVPQLRIFLGAVTDAYEFARKIDTRNHLKSICARNGAIELRITARSFVIAAGTIESTRILLEMDAQNGGRVVPEAARVGNYLSDHLSLAIADVEPGSLPLASRLFAPRFDHGRLRSFRFCEQVPVVGTPRSFSHFIFDNENAGFELAKKILAGLQSKKLPEVSGGEILKGISGLTALAWNRVARSRLFIPVDTPMHLQLDIEQAPSFDNRITLGKKLGAQGRPVAEIGWKINSVDYVNIENAAKRLLAKWPGSAKELPRLNAIDTLGIGAKPHDAYHPVGTCRMGEDREAVVSPDLKVHGTSNVFVLSTAVFPSAGSANPTFGMLCFADRLAELLSAELRLGT